MRKCSLGYFEAERLGRSHQARVEARPKPRLATWYVRTGLKARLFASRCLVAVIFLRS
jgi:hypothetical protein